MNYSDLEKKSHRKYSKIVYNSRPEVKEKNRARSRKWRAENLEKAREVDKRFYENHKSQRIDAVKLNNKKPCKDPILGDTVAYNTLIARRRYHPELYEGVVPKDCIIHIPKIKGLNLLSEEQRAAIEN